MGKKGGECSPVPGEGTPIAERCELVRLSSIGTGPDNKL